MKFVKQLTLAFTTLALCSAVQAEQPTAKVVVLKNKAVQLGVAVGGGAIVEFRFRDGKVNPLNWSSSPAEDPDQKGKAGIVLQGHFLCLDRWGAPSKAEQALGVPFHGEAARIPWRIQSISNNKAGQALNMSCQMKLARLAVDREVRLSPVSGSSSVVRVKETVTNVARLGRVYNLVQHPSIAPPFLDDTTIVDANAELGFLQLDSGRVPKSKKEALRWPTMMINSQKHDLRHFTGKVDSGHDVSSFRFSKHTKTGWVTACNPKQQLLLGYVWRTREYPWLNIWRYVDKGKVLARGLEFGTTGLHQPYRVLVKTNKALDRPLFAYIDAGTKQTRSYLMFLAKVPATYRGVARLELTKKSIVLIERKTLRKTTVAMSP